MSRDCDVMTKTFFDLLASVFWTQTQRGRALFFCSYMGALFDLICFWSRFDFGLWCGFSRADPIFLWFEFWLFGFSCFAVKFVILHVNRG